MGIVALWWGCAQDEETPTSPPAPLEVTWYQTLPNLVFQTTKYYTLMVAVSGIEPETVDSVKATIEDETAQAVAEFFLYDDANFPEHEDALNFCSPYSGDLVANNGIFSRSVNSGFAQTEGNYHFEVRVWFDGRSVASLPDTVIVALSAQPEISAISFPDTLESGFAPVQISLQAIDPDDPDVDSVTSVWMTLYSPDLIALGDPVTLEKLGGSYYGAELTPDLAVGRPSENYTFVFRALDTFDVISDSTWKAFYMENLAPHIADPAYPDTVSLPSPGNYTEVPINLRSWDDQTNADIDSVNMLSLKPNGQYANSGNPIPLEDIDEDSIFTINAVLYDTSLVGTYIFTFWARDLAGNKSEDLIDSLVVVAP